MVKSNKNLKQVLLRTPRLIYYKVKRDRTIYYKAKIRGKRICEPVSVSRDKLLNEIKRIKRLNDKP
jgi:hypothetical protein